jgi:glutaminase
VFSPRLDAKGNSVRGVAVCREFSRELGMHALRAPGSSAIAIRSAYDLASFRSKRIRREADRALLGEIGARTRVYELQGGLSFASCEVAMRRIQEESGGCERLILDFRRVFRVDVPATALLSGTLAALAGAGKQILLSGLRHGPATDRAWADLPAGAYRACEDLDRALERCENELIAAHRRESAPPGPVAVEDNDLLRGLSPDSITEIKRHLRFESFRPGEPLMREGEAATGIYLLTAGEVSVLVELPGGKSVRLATLSAGMSLGEIGVVTGSGRTADVTADTQVECYLLPKQALDRLSGAHLPARVALLENMVRQLAATAAQLTRQVSALAG